MKISAVITEYNPFHNGHKHQLSEIRKNGSDYIIAIMSGDFTQRGEPAICDKYTRTRMALENGADLVIELPVIYATADAGHFAGGAVSIINNLGVVDELAFGVETGCEELCFSIADFLLNPPSEYSKQLQAAVKEGISYPVARQKALSDHFSSSDLDKLSGSNMILAVEYIKALMKIDSSIKPVPYKRIGSAYNDILLNESGMSSASAIRESLRSDHTPETLKGNMPQSTVNLLSSANIMFSNDFSSFLHYKLITAVDYHNIWDITEGMNDRIKGHLNEFISFNSYTDIIKTKNITRASVSRILTHIMLGLEITPFDDPTYARILGFRKESDSLLGMIKNNSKIPMISKLADADIDNLLLSDIQAANIYNAAVTQKYQTTTKNEYNNGIVIV
ncbi:MAG: nucleotidyltransferase [Lachnospiraceae bacterium]|nr:nucleotidyltransferase [Candidatus Colinaster scatohippi]